MTASLATNIIVPAGLGAGPDPGTDGGGPNPYPIAQCTYGVWKYVHDHFGVDMPDLSGNATDWFHDAQQLGWGTTSDPTTDTAVCWSSTKYPPFGHVAWVTAIVHKPIQGEAIASTPGPASFTVHEWNFTQDLQPDDRTIILGSKDADGIEGFIKVPGVTPGASVNESIPKAGGDPWSQFSSGIQSAEQMVTQDLQSAFQKAMAAGQMVLGGLVMAGGTYMLAKGQLPTPANLAGKSIQPTGKSVQPKPAIEPAPKPAPAPRPTPNRALLKVARGRFSELTPAEVEWVQAHPGEVREALRTAGAAAGRAA